MHLLEKLERKLRPYAFTNLTLYIILGQGLFFLLMVLDYVTFEHIALVPSLVMEGQFWRIVTFLFVPPSISPLLLILSWYVFFLMGTALEHNWGTARYNLFLLIGYTVTIVVSFAFPNVYVSNVYLLGSVFLAFAFLNPNFELYLFFVLPVKIKWLALLSIAIYSYEFIVWDWSVRLAILASACNLLLFFGPAALADIKRRKRRLKMEVQQKVQESQPFHECVVCGITDKSHPHMDFRYSEGDLCYCTHCTEHIDNHEHVVVQKESDDVQ